MQILNEEEPPAWLANIPIQMVSQVARVLENNERLTGHGLYVAELNIHYPRTQCS